MKDSLLDNQYPNHIKKDPTFSLTGLDYDLYQADQQDRKRLSDIEKTVKDVRSIP